MAQQAENRTIGDAVELLKANGFAGLAEAVTVLMNNAMRSERSEYLRAAPYVRIPVNVTADSADRDRPLMRRALAAAH